MLELLLCSLLTILPDYLYRRYVQGKRLGKEITFYSVWFELRWGITALPDPDRAPDHDVSSTIIRPRPTSRCSSEPSRSFPKQSGASPRSIVGISGPVKKGAPIFRLDSSKQEAAVETARRKIAEVDAEMVVARADIAKAEGQIRRPRARISRPSTSWRPSRSCTGAIRATLPSARSRGSRSRAQGHARRDCRRDRREAGQSRSGSRRFSPRRKPAPKPRWRRPRSIWTRPSSVPA